MTMPTTAAGFVWPAGMDDPLPYIETFAQRVMPHIREAT
jgi:hypothetical protein